MEQLGHTLIVGIGATLVMDMWVVLRQTLLGITRLDYALLGRWFGHMISGRFRHRAIAASAPVRGERLIGWTMHYLIGTAFAALLLALWGLEWVQRPTLSPALIVGIGSAAAPILIMQPAMGASRTNRWGAAQLHSLLTHTIYGIGLYLAGWLDYLVLRP